MSRSISALAAVTAVAVLALCFAGAPPRPAAPPPRAPAPQPVDLQNKTCPVKGRPVVEGVTDTVNGAVVHFCCTGCVAKYRANPAEYASALRSEPEVARKLDALAGAAGGASPAPAAGPAPAAPNALNAKSTELHDGMRKLWDDHVTWTRLFVVSAVAGLPDKDATTNRLLRNQEDLGNAIKPYYGDEAGAKLTALLKDHITTAADLVGALKANDAPKIEAAKRKWSANADEIAAFLHGANPEAWPLDSLKSMMREHLDLTTEEVSARLKGDWEADVAAFENVREQALRMADMLSDGIRRQFSQKFQ